MELYKQISDANRIKYGTEAEKILRIIINQYSDRTHFIYEILQNAEDAGATRIQFHLEKEKLVIEHNGRPFNEKDIEGVCGIANGTKEDGTRIGHFGIGFKSVYCYTEHPYIYSGEYHFVIQNQLFPAEVSGRKEIAYDETCMILPFDNPTALVIENNPRNEMEIRYNPHALLMARHLGTELNACPCYWPRKKGKIERPFNYIEEQFIKGNHFASMEDLNRRGKDFVESWCNETHTTTKRIPNIHYLQEERDLLLPLPDRRYRLKELESRIISPDCYISIGGNKYSVPDIFAAKTMYFRIIYGFRIELYDRKKNYVMKLEASRNKHEILTNSEHYKNVAPKAPTSIPQIRREFTARYSNGLAYLEAAGKKFDQPTHYARKIMLLEELYDTDTLNRFIGYAIQHDSMDILSFKELLKAYNAGRLSLPEISEQRPEVLCKTGEYRDDDSKLLRDLDYYEQNVGGTVNA